MNPPESDAERPEPAPSRASEEPAVAELSPPSGWAFWRLRLARALVVGGLAVAVLRLAPALPREQHVIVEAPPGTNITALNLSWRSQEDDRVVGGVELKPHGETRRVSHLLKVPNGDYTLAVSAHVVRPDAAPTLPAPEAAATSRPPELLLLERTVSLDGDTTRLTLTDR